ncbi:hypothetical protein [Dyella kyungheensis]|uniref:Uncharacterized protein n=1 Tax=Dyella kyungheensis TaxID=1242174 RepID=A0ABS2JR79_9GAMM|nr:hypothetical protein [Dyella kyungheensis]MBM7121366.1 hypothetical protein [Dyella kyungheensis]
MYSEEASLWFTLANGGDEEAILIKAPTATIKSIIVGCEVSIVVGRYENYLCSGVRAFDVPDKPLLISGVQRYEDEHVALLRILSKDRVPIFLFNEMDFCVASSEAMLDRNAALLAKKVLENPGGLYVGDFTKEASRALDNFCFTVDDTLLVPHQEKIAIAEMGLSFGAWVATKITVAGVLDHKDVDVANKNEGDVLEAVTWAALDSVFPFAMHHSPQVVEGIKQRELIDVISSYEYGSFLFEAKDLSVLNVEKQRTQERRISTVKGHVKKALGQLRAATKSVRRGDVVRSVDGKVIDINLSKPPHCIVLITEFIEDGDWNDVFIDMFKMATEVDCFIHVLDIREFVNLLKICEGNPGHFDYRLMERSKFCVEKRLVHVRSRVQPG